MTCGKLIIFVTVFLSIHNVLTQIAVYNLELNDLYKMQTGIGWPHALHVVEGHEALLKLASTLENQEHCEVTTPAGQSFDVKQPPNNRFESWTDEGCGVRVKNVVHSDQGRWRLTAKSGDENITGWTEIYVEDNINQYTGKTIILHDGETDVNIDLTTLENSYCLVAQPFSDRSLVAGHCNVKLERTTRAVHGNWHVLLGLPGRVPELPIDRSVNVESERLDTGFIDGGNKLHIFCNLHNSEKNITFCRFQQTSAQSGYNVMDGLSDGRHSYYGDGFGQKQCGITIETPTASDFGSWRCTVGVQERDNNIIYQRTPMQALIRVSRATRIKRETSDITRINPYRTIFVQKDMTVTITCTAEDSLSYCWFQHPNGTQFTPVPLVNDDQLFWYSGESLAVGDCGITFTHVIEDDGGVWTCHMGPRGEVGMEITDKVNVRVTGPLAAREKEVVATVGGNATLYCHSSNGNRPLDYCRFLSPNYLGISIDETVTKDKAVLGRFYFTANRELNYGDCSLTIDPVTEQDVGIWTCATVVDNETTESRDTISLMLEEPQSRSTAGIVGMSIGIPALFLIFGGAMVYKYGYLPSIPWRRTNNTQATDNESLGRSSLQTSDIQNQDLRQASVRYDGRASNSSEEENEPNQPRVAPIIEILA